MRGIGLVGRRKAAPECGGRSRGRGVAPHPLAVDLSPEAVERVAARLAQLLGEGRGDEGDRLISAGELALRLRVERPWVYRNRRLLGGIRLGAGPKAPWRFEYGAAVAALRRSQGGRPDGGEGR